MPSAAYVGMTKFQSGKWRNHMQAWNISILLRNADSSVIGLQLVAALGGPFVLDRQYLAKNPKNTNVVSYVIRLFNIGKYFLQPQIIIRYWKWDWTSDLAIRNDFSISVNQLHQLEI